MNSAPALARRMSVAIGLATVVGAGAQAGTEALPQQGGRVDLASQANVEIHGAVASAGTGDSVAGAGDVNGDRLADLIVGAPGAGAAYVVFGRPEPAKIDLSALGSGGFRIEGAAATDRAGYAVAGAGDVNGDGRDDVLVGAHAADRNGRSNSGAVYVVFGKATEAPVDLAALENAGFRIDGASAGDRAGWSVASAGDVNGDGRPDILVGAAFADNNLRSGSGSAYVVFGKATPAPLDLAALGDQGFRIDGAAAQDFASEALASGGDLNADGKADVLVGATFADNNGRENSGSLYTVFGKSTAAGVDLAALGNQGFRIDGAAAGDGAGAAVAAGDLDGDRRPELLVGAVFADANGRQGSGSAYLLAGTGAPGLDLAGAAPLLRVDGAAPLDLAGGTVALPGDVNGDGRADVLVGAAGADVAGREDAGSAYAVFATGTPAVVDLASLGSRGYRMEGASAGDRAGEAVAGAGDVNGDGRADVVVGGSGADTSGGRGAGKAYVLYGFGDPELAYAPLTARVGRTVRRHAPRSLRRTGPARFSVSPPLPAGFRLDPRTGVVTGVPSVGARRRGHTVTMRDLAGSARARLAVSVSDRRSPRLRLGGPPTQAVLRRNAVVVAASCDEASRLTASGRIVVGGERKALGLRRSTARLVRPGTVRLQLALSTAAERRLRRLFAGGARARALVSVRAVDAFGNSATARRTVQLVR